MEDPKNMKVAELRLELEEHGVYFKTSTRKPELVRLAQEARDSKARDSARRVIDEVDDWFLKRVLPPEPDILARECMSPTEGWTYNIYTRRVRKLWTTLYSHGASSDRQEWSSGGRDLFSKKEDALRRLRYEVLKLTLGWMEKLEA
jgi:hypothetical protein